MNFICKYCGKEVGNKGCLILHETQCKLNPNRIYRNPNKNRLYEYNEPWNKGLTKENNDSLKQIGLTLKNKYKNGELIPSFLGKHHTEETKKRISEKRKQWLLDHKDQHVWRRDSKFLSIPCENLKQYLRDKGINFVEEYEPFDDINYCVDIAWPDEKIAIEVNGNQHYNRDGSLSKYYQKRHNLFVSRGWKLFEIHYSKCFNIDINDINNILNLPIYDKDYVGKYFSKKEKQKEKQKEKTNKKNKQKQKIRNEKKQEIEKQHKQIIYNLINNSGIDFTKSKWSAQAINYLLKRNELWNKGIFRCIRKYYPEFLQREDIYKRKGSIY